MDKSQIHVSKPPASPVVLKDHASIFIYPAGNGKFTASAHTYTDTGPHWENTQSFDTVEEALANLSGLLGTPDALLTRIAELKEALAVAESRVAELEQQNAKKDAVLAKITRMVDLAEKANDERTEMEVALSASFDEAIAHQMLEIEEAKVSTLERENAELSAALQDVIEEAEENVLNYHQSMRGYRQYEHDRKDAVIAKARAALAQLGEKV